MERGDSNRGEGCHWDGRGRVPLVWVWTVPTDLGGKNREVVCLLESHRRDDGERRLESPLFPWDRPSVGKDRSHGLDWSPSRPGFPPVKTGTRHRRIVIHKRDTVE